MSCESKQPVHVAWGHLGVHGDGPSNVVELNPISMLEASESLCLSGDGVPRRPSSSARTPLSSKNTEGGKAPEALRRLGIGTNLPDDESSLKGVLPFIIPSREGENRALGSLGRDGDESSVGNRCEVAKSALRRAADLRRNDTGCAKTWGRGISRNMDEYAESRSRWEPSAVSTSTAGAGDISLLHTSKTS